MKLLTKIRESWNTGNQNVSPNNLSFENIPCNRLVIYKTKRIYPNNILHPHRIENLND